MSTYTRAGMRGRSQPSLSMSLSSRTTRARRKNTHARNMLDMCMRASKSTRRAQEDRASGIFIATGVFFRERKYLQQQAARQ